MQLFYAVLTLALIGALLGLLLGIADKYLQVKTDDRIAHVIEMLPNINCGACGYPGCAGMAEGLVTGDAKTVSLCKPSKLEGRELIRKYLAETPGPDGDVIIVTA